MKKVICFVIAGLLAGSSAMIAAPRASSSAAEDAYSASDWKPFNYVLTEGAGLNTRYLDIRTHLSYENNELTATGSTTKGGMGVSFAPEIDITDCSFNMSMNNWQEVSTDRWFGFTLTDVLEKTDNFNEVPFYSKHSESWSNDYGAGILFAMRPSTEGQMTIQFNYIGINPSFDADGEFNTEAGEYSDGYLGWAGWISTIQLCNKDWTPKTDYADIKISMKGITENGKEGIAFDLNDGYFKRTDYTWKTPENEAGLTPAETTFEEDVFEKLDLDGNGYLPEAEFNNFIYGSAWNDGAEKQSVIPYANYGDSFYALTQFQKKLTENGKRLYLSVMYKDAWDMMEGTGEASFTVHSVNGKNATKSETTDLFADATVTGDIGATISETQLHAGVYPSTVKALEAKELAEKDYEKAKANIESAAKAEKKAWKVVSIVGKTESGANVSFIDETTVSLDTSVYKGVKVYKIVGTDVDEITTTEADGKVTFKMNSSNLKLVLMTDKEGGKGCNSAVNTVAFGMVVGIAVAALGVCLAVKKKKEN